MSFRHEPGVRDWRPTARLLALAAIVAVALVVGWGTIRGDQSRTHLTASTSQAPGSAAAAGLPADLAAEIAANDAAGLPGLGRGVTVPAGCDIATDTDPNVGRPRIERERTVHRQLNAGNSAAFIAAGNAQLQAYLQVSVRDYCAGHDGGAEAMPGSAPAPAPAPAGGGSTAGLPAALQAEIRANDAAGLPGLGRGVTVPAGCDIATDTDANVGRPRIERERTVHRQMNAGNSAAFITAGNAQLQAYLQVSVRDYCATHN